jgi:hypothetical protein
LLVSAHLGALKLPYYLFRGASGRWLLTWRAHAAAAASGLSPAAADKKRTKGATPTATSVVASDVGGDSGEDLDESVAAFRSVDQSAPFPDLACGGWEENVALLEDAASATCADGVCGTGGGVDGRKWAAAAELVVARGGQLPPTREEVRQRIADELASAKAATLKAAECAAAAAHAAHSAAAAAQRRADDQHTKAAAAKAGAWAKAVATVEAALAAVPPNGPKQAGPMGVAGKKAGPMGGPGGAAPRSKPAFPGVASPRLGRFLFQLVAVDAPTASQSSPRTLPDAGEVERNSAAAGGEVDGGSAEALGSGSAVAMAHATVHSTTALDEHAIEDDYHDPISVTDTVMHHYHDPISVADTVIQFPHTPPPLPPPRARAFPRSKKCHSFKRARERFRTKKKTIQR